MGGEADEQAAAAPRLQHAATVEPGCGAQPPHGVDHRRVGVVGVERRRRGGAQLARIEASLKVAAQTGERFPVDGRVEQLRQCPPTGPQTEAGPVVVSDQAAALVDVVEGGECGEVAAGPVGQRRRGERGRFGPVGGITCSGIGPIGSGRDGGVVRG